MGGSAPTRLERLLARTFDIDFIPSSSSSSSSSLSSSLSSSSLSSMSASSSSSSSSSSRDMESVPMPSSHAVKRKRTTEAAFSRCLSNALNDGYSECFCRAAFSTREMLSDCLASRAHLGDMHGPLAFLCERSFAPLLTSTLKRRRLLRSARSASVLRGDYAYDGGSGDREDNESFDPAAVPDDWSALAPLELDVGAGASTSWRTRWRPCGRPGITDQPLAHRWAAGGPPAPAPRFLAPPRVVFRDERATRAPRRVVRGGLRGPHRPPARALRVDPGLRRQCRWPRRSRRKRPSSSSSSFAKRGDDSMDVDSDQSNSKTASAEGGGGGGERRRRRQRRPEGRPRDGCASPPSGRPRPRITRGGPLLTL